LDNRLPGPNVIRGAAPDADGHLQISGDGFAQLVAGELDVRAAMHDGSLRFAGDVDALRAVATAFSVAKWVGP